MTEDLGPYPVLLPSGQAVAQGDVGGMDHVLGGSRPLPHRLRPGSYPVHVTLVRERGSSADLVALASLVVSEAPTVRWRDVLDISVETGSAIFTSLEGADAIGRMMRAGQERFFAFSQNAFRSLEAAGRLIDGFPIDEKLNLVQFSSGTGDGGYGVYVGLDAKGEPTRFVIDFLLLDLAWP